MTRCSKFLIKLNRMWNLQDLGVDMIYNLVILLSNLEESSLDRGSDSVLHYSLSEGKPWGHETSLDFSSWMWGTISSIKQALSISVLQSWLFQQLLLGDSIIHELQRYEDSLGGQLRKPVDGYSPGVLSIKGDGNLVITDEKGSSLTINSETTCNNYLNSRPHCQNGT